MGSSLGHVLANIIMTGFGWFGWLTELEGKVIRSLISDGTIKFYGRYVDDTLLVINPHDIDHVRNLLNEFDPNL